MRIESGPAKADRNWQIIRAVLFLGFSLWFVYDGAISYPAKNEAQAKKILQAPEPFGGAVKWEDLGEAPTKAAFERVKQTKPTAPAPVREALGEPQFVEEEDSLRRTEFFVSKYGHGMVPIRAGRVDPSGMVWTKWYKSKEEIQGQFFWAIIPGIPGLYFLYRMFKAMSLRVVVDDEGMIYDGNRIAFADMVSLRDYSPKGWIDLYYNDDGRERKLRLDNEKVLLFDEIVDAICQQKGFENEVKKYHEEQAQAAAEEAAAEQETTDDQDEEQPQA